MKTCSKSITLPNPGITKFTVDYISPQLNSVEDTAH